VKDREKKNSQHGEPSWSETSDSDIGHVPAESVLASLASLWAR
jgi:hypothetical protein